jgi:hypothetical protein
MAAMADVRSPPLPSQQTDNFHGAGGAAKINLTPTTTALKMAPQGQKEEFFLFFYKIPRKNGQLNFGACKLRGF